MTRLIVLSIIASAVPWSAADAQPDAAAPSLAVPSDAATPYYSLAVSSDVLGYLFGQYGVEFEGALSRHHALATGVGVVFVDDAPEVRLGVRYHLWPLGDGLSGMFLGPACDLVMRGRDTWAPEAAVEGGFSWVLLGMVGTAGLRASAPLADPLGFDVLARLSLGYAFM